MFWPGMGDPTKRKKTLRFLAITAVIGISVGVTSSLILTQIKSDNPLYTCINDLDTPFRASAMLELYVDGAKAHIPANVGFGEGGCQKAMYTLSDDGKIYAEWTEEYPFEIGHFLWMWDFPLRDMQQDKSRVLVNGVESDMFINHPFQDGMEYRAEFISKEYDESKDTDFLPPDLTP